MRDLRQPLQSSDSSNFPRQHPYLRLFRVCHRRIGAYLYRMPVPRYWARGRERRHDVLRNPLRAKGTCKMKVGTVRAFALLFTGAVMGQGAHLGRASAEGANPRPRPHEDAPLRKPPTPSPPPIPVPDPPPIPTPGPKPAPPGPAPGPRPLPPPQPVDSLQS